MPHVLEFGRTDDIHRSLRQLSPVTKRRNDHTRVDIIGKLGIESPRS